MIKRNCVKLRLFNSRKATSVKVWYNYTFKPVFLYVFLDNFKLQATSYDLVGGFYDFQSENKTCFNCNRLVPSSLCFNESFFKSRYNIGLEKN